MRLLFETSQLQLTKSQFLLYLRCHLYSCGKWVFSAGSATKKQAYMILAKGKQILPKIKPLALNYWNYDRGLSSGWFQAVL